MAKLVNVRLSANEDTAIIDVANGLQGKCNETQNGKRFVVLEFEDDSNLFKMSRAARTYWMNEAGKWAGATPDQLAKYVGKEVPGKFVTHKVAPYEVGGRVVSSYTTFVMSHENDLTVFASAGYTVLDNEGNVLAQAIVRDGSQSFSGVGTEQKAEQPTEETAAF